MAPLIVFIAIGILCPVICSRLLFLCATRAGAVPYYANIIFEVFPRWFGIQRAVPEYGSLLIGVTLLNVSSLNGLVYSLVILVAFCILEIALLRKERVILTAAYGRHLRSTGVPWSVGDELEYQGSRPSPSPHPELTVNFGGPFVKRNPSYDLGDIPVGRMIELELLVGNHTEIPGQVPVKVRCLGTPGLSVAARFDTIIPPLRSGDLFRGRLVLTAHMVSSPGRITIEINTEAESREYLIHYRSIFNASSEAIVTANISRYSGACEAAFAWRGDMDLYDTSSFQSIAGLKRTLDLAARYLFPHTMYLSARLCLDSDEARAYHAHFGVSRGYEEIPEFISWLRDNVDFRHQVAYPWSSSKPYVMELGNHMFLHYGTDAAASPGNNWKVGARMGEGHYEWMGHEGGSFAEQRDNALAAQALIEKHLSFTPRSWAMPDSTNDEHTARAVEAAGLMVTSDVDATLMDNVFRQPPPHHPPGSGVVELTKRYPGDPETIYHVAMVLYWLHRALRLKIPMIFMCHHHMRQFAGHSCTRFTEYIVRYVLDRFNGDFYINTVCGIGMYWKEVLSPSHRSVTVSANDGKIIVRNRGTIHLTAVPVDLMYKGARHTTVLLDLAAGSTAIISSLGVLEKGTDEKC